MRKKDLLSFCDFFSVERVSTRGKETERNGEDISTEPTNKKDGYSKNRGSETLVCNRKFDVASSI